MGKERQAFDRSSALLLEALTDPSRVGELSHSELDLLVQLARRVRLHARLCADLMRIGILDRLPPVAADQLTGALAMAEARQRRAGWELDRVALALRSDPELVIVILKGCAYQELGLSNAAGRVFSDVDLLVAKEHLKRAETLLNRWGWATKELSPYDDNYYRRWSHELPPLMNAEREVEIDLHHSIAPNTSRVAVDGARLLERACAVPRSQFRVLSGEDVVLHAMVHLTFAGDMSDGLRELVDIADLIEHFSTHDAEFWHRFQSRAVELGLTRPAYYGLRYSARFLDVSIPDGLRETMREWAPPAAVVWAMDRLVPRALFPPHPDYPERTANLCRLALYIRSKWVSMPPVMLTYHLAWKFVARRIEQFKRTGTDGQPAQ